MKILLLCGYFAEENEPEVLAHARSTVQFSANLFQRKLIAGFCALEQELFVVSAPFIGSYPNESDIRVFRGFAHPQNECRYVPFHNLWGLRNFSRAGALKKAIRFFIEDPAEEKLIVVYCPHTPFLEAAHYAKRQDPRIRIGFYVPDLPQFMNLNASRSKLYDLAKAVDIAKMRTYMASVDAYVLLTEQMKQALPVGEKPCLVVEGIIDAIPEIWESDPEYKYVVYTGKLNEAFGVKALIDGFRLVEGSEYRLVLCGAGDCLDYARDMAKLDSRILVTGQLPPEEAKRWQHKAALLINPRPNQGEYTQYSFPSKLLEYLLTGRPVAAYMLEGMPDCYRHFLYVLDEALPAAEAIRAAIVYGQQGCEERYRRFCTYAETHLNGTDIARKIVEMTRNQTLC